MGLGLHTALCEELDIKYPVFSVGLGDGARAELVAAVSNAGGFGVLGASGMSPDMITQRIAVQALTGLPFGVNLIIDEAGEEDHAFLRDQVVAVTARRVAALVLFWGDPGPYVELAHRNGVRVFIQVGSVEEAKAAAATGVDVVIAQGVEAGGHVRGTASIWDLLPATVEAIRPMPVVASGGIGDGSAVARAPRLGAQAVSLGTRFVASDEAWFHPAYKRRIVDSTAQDTVHSELHDEWWPGAAHRRLRNRTFNEWDAAGRPPPGKRPGEGTIIGKRRLASGEWQNWPRYAVGALPPDFDGDLERVPMFAGESCTVVDDIKPAGEIVRDIARDAVAALDKA